MPYIGPGLQRSEGRTGLLEEFELLRGVFPTQNSIAVRVATEVDDDGLVFQFELVVVLRTRLAEKLDRAFI